MRFLLVIVVVLVMVYAVRSAPLPEPREKSPFILLGEWEVEWQPGWDVNHPNSTYRFLSNGVGEYRVTGWTGFRWRQDKDMVEVIHADTELGMQTTFRLYPAGKDRLEGTYTLWKGEERLCLPHPVELTLKGADK